MSNKSRSLTELMSQQPALSKVEVKGRESTDPESAEENYPEQESLCRASRSIRKQIRYTHKTTITIMNTILIIIGVVIFIVFAFFISFHELKNAHELSPDDLNF